jgi:phosphohistidine phosphatase
MSWSRRLLLFRHAKSDSPQGGSDHERPLGPRGRHDAPRMGEEMARRGLKPELALVSTATRTRETFALVKPFLPEVPARF